MASAAFESALEDRQNDVPALAWLGQSLVDLGRFAEAELRLQAAIELESDFAPAHALLGDTALYRRDFASAAKHFETALRLQPQADRLHYQLANAYRGLGDKLRSSEHLKLRGERVLTFPDPLMRQIEELARTSSYLVEKGQEALQAGRYPQAVEIFRQVLEGTPGNITARINLGSALARMGRSKEAIAEYREVLTHQPKEVMAHFNLGTLMAGLGNDDAAVQHYRQAIATDPGFRDAHLNLANALFRVGSFEEAAEVYARVRGFDSTSTEAIRGEALALARLRRYAEALARLEAGHRAFAEDLPIANGLARLLATCPDATLRNGPRALELAHKTFSAERTLDHVVTLAMAYAEVGDFEQALEWQQSALKVAERAQRPDVVSSLREMLESYNDAEPWRRPWS